MKAKNPFGGGRANSLYVPMSEVEQEFLSRLVEAGDLRVHVVGWGVVNRPRVVLGDLRLSLYFRLDFDRPEVPMAVPHFDLELRTGSGILLFAKRQSTVYNGAPISVAAGMFLDMVWDVAIQNIDPKLVKTLMPQTTGFTSRLVDKDTGNITLEGNMHLTPTLTKVLHQLRDGEAKVRQHMKKKLK